MATKNIIVELYKGEKLNGDMWISGKGVVYCRGTKQEALEPLPITIVVVEPDVENTT